MKLIASERRSKLDHRADECPDDPRRPHAQEKRRHGFRARKTAVPGSATMFRSAIASSGAGWGTTGGIRRTARSR